jgi:hypothetical protein
LWALLAHLASGPADASELRAALKLTSRHFARDTYIGPALEAGLIERTIPDKPNSRLQKYRITAAGRAALVQRRKP